MSKVKPSEQEPDQRVKSSQSGLKSCNTEQMLGLLQHVSCPRRSKTKKESDPTPEPALETVITT